MHEKTCLKTLECVLHSFITYKLEFVSQIWGLPLVAVNFEMYAKDNLKKEEFSFPA